MHIVDFNNYLVIADYPTAQISGMFTHVGTRKFV